MTTEETREEWRDCIERRRASLRSAIDTIITEYQTIEDRCDRAERFMQVIHCLAHAVNEGTNEYEGWIWEELDELTPWAD